MGISTVAGLPEGSSTSCQLTLSVADLCTDVSPDGLSLLFVAGRRCPTAALHRTDGGLRAEGWPHASVYPNTDASATAVVILERLMLTCASRSNESTARDARVVDGQRLMIKATIGLFSDHRHLLLAA
jgi:hypothetical protein